MRKKDTHGGAIVEFALLCPFLGSLIIGTMIYGTELTKELELQQVARDTASMTARGTNFQDAANQQIVSRLGRELNWPDSSGLTSTSPGVVYVSTIKYLDGNCNGITPKCSNAGYWVFVRSVAFGNTNMRKSNFGAPAPCLTASPSCLDPAQTDGSLLSDKVLNDAGARLTNFGYLGTPDFAKSGFQPGQPAYLIEVAGVTGPWYGGAIGYAFSLF